MNDVEKVNDVKEARRKAKRGAFAIRKMGKKYGKKINAIQLGNRAVRGEIVGGAMLLDTSETISAMLARKPSKDCRAFLRNCLDRIANIKHEMTLEVLRRNEPCAGEEELFDWLTEMDELMKGEKLPDDTFDALKFVRRKMAEIYWDMLEADNKD